MLCTKWAHLNWCLLQVNKLLTGACLHGVASPLLFKQFEDVWASSLWVLVLDLVPFLPDIGFQLLKSSWLSLTYFSFNDAPNVLYRWKIWTAGRPIQHPVFSTTKPCCCNSCSMCFALSCWNTQGLPRNRRRLEGAYVALKPLYTFQHS